MRLTNLGRCGPILESFVTSSGYLCPKNQFLCNQHKTCGQSGTRSCKCQTKRLFSNNLVFSLLFPQSKKIPFCFIAVDAIITAPFALSVAVARVMDAAIAKTIVFLCPAFQVTSTTIKHPMQRENFTNVRCKVLSGVVSTKLTQMTLQDVCRCTGSHRIPIMH